MPYSSRGALAGGRQGQRCPARARRRTHARTCPAAQASAAAFTSRFSIAAPSSCLRASSWPGCAARCPAPAASVSPARHGGGAPGFMLTKLTVKMPSGLFCKPALLTKLLSGAGCASVRPASGRPAGWLAGRMLAWRTGGALRVGSYCRAFTAAHALQPGRGAGLSCAAPRSQERTQQGKGRCKAAAPLSGWGWWMHSQQHASWCA